MIEMRKEFQRVLSLCEALRADFESAQHLFCSGSHESDDPESQDPTGPNCISNPVLPPDPDAESFQDVLQEELAIPLSERLRRNLIDGILLRVEEPFRHQRTCLGSDPEMISHLFSNWILDDARPVPPLTWDERSCAFMADRTGWYAWRTWRSTLSREDGVKLILNDC
jgi:hypothetical protein